MSAELPTLLVGLGFCVANIGLLTAIFFRLGSIAERLDAAGRELADHETRLRELEHVEQAL